MNTAEIRSFMEKTALEKTTLKDHSKIISSMSVQAAFLTHFANNIGPEFESTTSTLDYCTNCHRGYMEMILNFAATYNSKKNDDDKKMGIQLLRTTMIKVSIL